MVWQRKSITHFEKYVLNLSGVLASKHHKARAQRAWHRRKK